MFEALAQSQTIARPRLNDRFNEGRDRRLTLVEAPLGYGKTTLILSWVDQLSSEGVPVALVSLDATIRHRFDRVNEALSSLGFHYDESEGLIVNPDAALAGRCFLVLDDFHEADDACRSFVRDVLRGEDHGLHILIGTREPPGLPLTKLRMADLVNDFTTDDLRFDLSETLALFRGDLSEPEVQGYLERAEGWVAALQLLRLFGVQRGGSPPDFDKLTQFGEYLNEQYFDQLSEEQRFILLRTAHVERVDGDLANWLTGRDDGWSQLSHLSGSNALIFAETQAETTSFRYHPLLRDFLRRKQQQMGETNLSALHRATSDWYAKHSNLFEAMTHASRAGDPELAERLLLAAGGVRFGMLHGAGRLAACLETLTPEQILASPRLLLVRAYVLLKTGRIREASSLLDDVRCGSHSAESELEREIVLVEAHLRIYSDAEMSRRRLEALEHTIVSAPQTDPLARGLLSNFLCMFLIEFGDFRKAREFGEQAMALYRDIGAVHLQFFMHLHLSAIDLDQLSLEPALEARKQARALCLSEFSSDPSLCAIAEIYHGETEFEAGEIDGLSQRLRGSLLRIDRMEGWNMLFLAGYETCLSLLVEDGEFEAAVELCEHASNLVSRRGMVLFSNQLLAMQLDLAVRAGARREAQRLARELNNLLTDGQTDAALRWRGRVRAELAMARHEAEIGADKSALERVLRTVRYCRAEGLVRLEMRAQVRRICLEARLEHVDACHDALRDYLALARTHGGFGAILRERDAFRDAVLWLVMSKGLGSMNAEDIRLLAVSLWTASGRRPGESNSILSEILTEKELGVLTELAKGSANKVIARALDVSEPTVKFHLQNIYKKLGVNSRKLAAEIALQHTLGPDDAGDASAYPNRIAT